MLITSDEVAADSHAGDDRWLLNQLVRGDAEAFGQIVARYTDRIFAIARRQVRDPQTAEDVVQAVYIVLARKAKFLREDTILFAWLHRTTMLASLSAIRSERRFQNLKKRRMRELAQNEPVAGGAVDEQILASLDGALADLGEKDRSAVTLRYLENKPFAEVASAIGTSEAAATKRVNRALLKLRGLLLRRGVRINGGELATILSVAPPMAPIGLVKEMAQQAVLNLKGGGAVGKAAIIAKSIGATTTPSKAAIAAAIGFSACMGAVVVAIIWFESSSRSVEQPAFHVISAPARNWPFPAPPDRIQYKAVDVNDPALAGFPYMKGWPKALPGATVAAPVVADLRGDGKLEVIVPCIQRDMQTVHPQGNTVPLLFAFNSDGTMVPGWPIAVGNSDPKSNAWGGWASSPSIFRTASGHDALVGAGPQRNLYIINGDVPLPRGLRAGDRTINIPIVDLGGGVPAMISGRLIRHVDGRAVEGWPTSRQFKNGYAPCVGDASGDGRMMSFHLFFTTPGTNLADVGGFDAHGNKLPGWPKQIDDPSWLGPVMGDVLGDGKMQIIGCYGTHIFAWTYDGKPLANTIVEGPLDGILKTNVQCEMACAALADLDGDGKAEIIVFDRNLQAIRAFHGDGRGVGNETGKPDAAAEDGIIARLPVDCSGVSVVSLGDDPRVMDFFAGSYWVRRWPDGKTKITNMVPSEASTEWAQPTISDINGDGLADVIFGLSDGRVFVYETHLAYHAERMQWPTANGNFQHTGAWKRP